MRSNSDSISIEDHRKLPFFQVDNRIIDEYGPRIGCNAVAVYCCLCRHSYRKTEKARVSIRKISSSINLGKSSVDRAIDILEEHKLVRRDDNPKDSNNVPDTYIILDIPVPLQVQVEKEPVPLQVQPVPSGVQPVPLQVHITRSIKTDKKNENNVEFPLEENREELKQKSDLHPEMGVIAWLKKTWPHKWNKKILESPFIRLEELAGMDTFRSAWVEYLEDGKPWGKEQLMIHPIDFQHMMASRIGHKNGNGNGQGKRRNTDAENQRIWDERYAEREREKEQERHVQESHGG